MKRVRHGLSFSVSGHLITYHIGVARTLLGHKSFQAYAGTSGGAVAAALVARSAEPVPLLENLLGFAVRRRFLRGLQQLLPEADSWASSPLYVSVTEAVTGKNWLLTEKDFRSRAEMKSCCYASCWLPTVGAVLRRGALDLTTPFAAADAKTLELPSGTAAFLDGLFSDACPTPSEAPVDVWLTVSPFSGPPSPTHICPSDSSPRLGTVTLPGGLQVYVSLDNILRVTGVYWWPMSWLQAAHQRGCEDAARYLHQSGE